MLRLFAVVSNVVRKLFPIERWLKRLFRYNGKDDEAKKRNKQVKLREKKIIELYVIFKTALTAGLSTLSAFLSGWSVATIVVVSILLYFALDTISYLVHVVIVHRPDVDEYFMPGRTIILVLMNYAQLICVFTFIYSSFNLICGVNNSWLRALYFSVVTSATVGYGEMKPIGRYGQLVTSVQIIVMVVFTVLFFGNFVSMLSKPRTGRENKRSGKKLY